MWLSAGSGCHQHPRALVMDTVAFLLMACDCGYQPSLSTASLVAPAGFFQPVTGSCP